MASCTYGPDSTGRRCGKPAIHAWKGTDGREYAECAEHASRIGSIRPFAQTETERRRVRQAIRNELGVSRDPAPSLWSLKNVVSMLDGLLGASTAGRFRLRVYDRESGEHLALTEFAELVRKEGA